MLHATHRQFEAQQLSVVAPRAAPLIERVALAGTKFWWPAGSPPTCRA